MAGAAVQGKLTQVTTQAKPKDKIRAKQEL
jgi:hypothetical protein